MTELHYLPRRDPIVQRYVDRIDVDVPALARVSKPVTALIEVAERDENGAWRAPHEPPAANTWGLN